VTGVPGFSDVQAEGRAYQDRVHTPYTKVLTGDPGFLSGEVLSIGLEQVWHDGPGQMEIEILVSFPATSSATNFRNRFLSIIKEVSWTASYSAYKAK
jgi:hypothetical protein